MKIKLKLIASKELSEEVEKELLIPDPPTGDHNARRRKVRDHSESGKKDSK